VAGLHGGVHGRTVPDPFDPQPADRDPRDVRLGGARRADDEPDDRPLPQLAGGPTILFNALATTAVAFVALSGYAIVSRRDFSFMGGFLFVGFIVALVAIIANIFLQIPVLSLAISSVVVLLCAGSMLYNVSRLVHDGNADPLMIVVELFADIAVMFSHLLNLFGIMGSDD